MQYQLRAVIQLLAYLWNVLTLTNDHDSLTKTVTQYARVKVKYTAALGMLCTMFDEFPTEITTVTYIKQKLLCTIVYVRHC